MGRSIMHSRPQLRGYANHEREREREREREGVVGPSISFSHFLPGYSVASIKTSVSEEEPTGAIKMSRAYEFITGRTVNL